MSFKGSVRFTKTVDTAKASKEGTAKGIIQTALNIKREAKLLAPVAAFNGGRLRNSIDIEDLISSELAAKVGTNVEYGVYQEYGTRNMSAQPFMRPALEISKGKSVEETKRALNEAMK